MLPVPNILVSQADSSREYAVHPPYCSSMVILYSSTGKESCLTQYGWCLFFQAVPPGFLIPELSKLRFFSPAFSIRYKTSCDRWSIFSLGKSAGFSASENA